MKQIIPVLLVIVLTTGCSKSSDPTPATKSDYGSWTYSGNTYKGTYAMWSSSALVANADKPHLSSLQAYFNSANPAAGTYTIVSSSANANQVTIGLADDNLPAKSYISPDSNPGTVTVTKSGSSITVTLDKVKLMGFTSSAVPDSTVVTGTIIK